MANGVRIPVTADTTQATKALKNISTQVDSIAKTHTGIRGLTQTVASFGVAWKTVSSMVGQAAQTVGDLMDAYAGAARQTYTMEATIKALGASCSVTSSDVLDLADSLSKVTAYDDDVIVGVQQLLLTTKTLSADGLKQATEATLDMASALGIDAKNAASSLARALADPADNMRALRSANIQFTDAEEETLKTLQESGKQWEVQKIILDKIESVYGGVAKAVGDTDIGKLDKIQVAAGNLQENLGHALTNMISPYLDAIYTSIVRLSNWVDEHNAATSLSMALQNGGSLADFSTSALTERYIQRSRERSSLLVDIAQSGLLDASGNVIDPASLGAANNPTASELYRSWTTLNDEMTRITRELASRNAASTLLPSAVPAAAGGGAVSASSTASSHALDPFLESNKNLSPSIMIESLRRAVLEAGDQLNAHRGTDEESLYQDIFEARQRTYLDALYPSKTQGSAVGDFLTAHSSMSTTMQVADIDSQLAQARALQAKGGMSDQEADSIQEVIDKLQEQKDGLLGISAANEQVKTGAEKYAEAYAASTKYISQATQMLGSFFDLYDQLLSNDVDSLDKQLSDAEDKWDEYFDHLESRQEQQKETLGVMYDENLISAEDYIAALSDLDEERTDAEKERSDEEEELQHEADRLKEKQFNANKLNNIAQVLVNGATAAAGVWADPGYPAAIPLTIMLGAMNAAQVATIAAQKYTPMSTGGIVQGPTHAYLGEGSEAEAVMPLSKLSDVLRNSGEEMAPSSGGSINLTFNFGDGYDSDEVVGKIYQALNNAQERGVLPAWSVR